MLLGVLFGVRVGGTGGAGGWFGVRVRGNGGVGVWFSVLPPPEPNKSGFTPNNASPSRVQVTVSVYSNAAVQSTSGSSTCKCPPAQSAP